MKSSSLIYSLLLISEPFLSGDLFLLPAWSLPVFSIVTSTKKEKKNNFHPRFFTFQHQNKKQVSPLTSLRQYLSHFKHPSMPRVLPCRTKTIVDTIIIALGPLRFCCTLPHKHPDHEEKDQNWPSCSSFFHPGEGWDNVGFSFLDRNTSLKY